ncbi:hypothetical protein [Streptomyces venezuelae]|uniref:hypothetical protein n=1 Tax=Streptomyces venezuelae TaxID=54571 RepID=UPI0034170245
MDESERWDTCLRWGARGGKTVGVVGAAVFSWLMAGAFLSGSGAADAAPPDLCSLIAAKDTSRIVPLPRTSHQTDPRHDVRNEAECNVTSGKAWLRDGGRYGRLHINLTRHGNTRQGDGWSEARETYNRSKKYDAGDGSAPRDVPGVGEEAYVEVRSKPASGGQSGRRAEAELTVLLGKDVLNVKYVARPSTPKLAREVAVATSAAVLGGL